MTVTLETAAFRRQPVPAYRNAASLCRHRVASAAAVLAACAACTASGTAAAQALPFLPPGDVRLRHEVQLEVDAGRVPLGTTWPIPTRDLPEARRNELRSTRQPGTAADAGWFVQAAEKPMRLRTFADTPREHGEVGVQAGWVAGDYAGGALRVSYALEPEDDKSFRLDDSYAAWRFGNWWVSAGWQQRWWGPGHDGSLILSNNARPLPGLALTRASSKPFETRWLSWIGPWNLTTFMGVFEGTRTDFMGENPLLWGFRGTVRPLQELEIGASRTAQWCRPGLCGLETFRDVLLARDTAGATVAADEEPGNQLAGVDARLRSPWAAVPLAIYWSTTGEDRIGDRFTKRLVQYGLETWGRAGNGSSWRAFVEYADTACEARAAAPVFGCAYESAVFTGGYRTRGRVIGHSVERDGRLYSVGGLYVLADGSTIDLRVRKAELNRGAVNGASPSNTVSPVAADLWNLELGITARWRQFALTAGVGADRLEALGAPERTLGRAFVGLSSNW